MSIIISLSPEFEAKLREKAAEQGQDVSVFAAELLTEILNRESQDSQEAIAGIQDGLDAFTAGNFRPFQEFADEKRQKFNL